jgi:hypothetical protein
MTTREQKEWLVNNVTQMKLADGVNRGRETIEDLKVSSVHGREEAPDSGQV